MAKNDNLQDLLQSVADAIRAKKGTTGTINAQDFDSEIASISGGGSGIADSTKTLVNAISGVTPTDETTLNNAIAKAYADTPSEQKWNGTRSTAEGGTIKDGVAFVESVKGSTMKYKQEAVAIGSRNPVNGITRTNIDAQTIKVSGTSTSSANYTITENYTSIAGHKYLAVLVGMPLTCGCRGSARLGHNSSIYTQGSSATTANIGMYIPSGVALDSEIKPMLFDLTEMGLDSHTEPDEVAKVFGYADCESMPFMGYQPTTKLLNFTHNEVVSKGRKVVQILGNGATNKSGLTWSHNVGTINGTFNSAIVYNTIGAGATYTALVNGDKYCFIMRKLSGEGSVTFNTNGLITNANGADYVAHVNTSKSSGYATYMTLNGTYSNYKFDIMVFNLTAMGVADLTTAEEVANYLGFDSVADMPTIEQNEGTRETLDTLSLNVPTSVFPNGMMGVGSTYDEIRPAEGKVYSRFASKDLGSVNWSYSTAGYFLSQSVFPNMNTTDIICLRYPVISNATDPIPHIMRIGSKRMYIKDDTFEGDTTAFKASLNGVIAYYPLETPTEQTIAKAKAFYKVANGGTESISGGTDSAPIKAVIGYRGMSAEELVNAINI